MFNPIHTACVLELLQLPLYIWWVSCESFQGSSGAQEVKAFPFLAAPTGLFGINIEAWAVLPATYTKSKDKAFTVLPTPFHWQMISERCIAVPPQQWTRAALATRAKSEWKVVLLILFMADDYRVSHCQRILHNHPLTLSDSPLNLASTIFFAFIHPSCFKEIYTGLTHHKFSAVICWPISHFCDCHAEWKPISWGLSELGLGRII